jgi:hypothetical protein
MREKKPNLKLKYRINLKKAISILTNYMSKLLFTDNIVSFSKRIIDIIGKFKSAVRPGRSSPRTRSYSHHSVLSKPNFASRA